jgi:hypothetical protein
MELSVLKQGIKEMYLNIRYQLQYSLAIVEDLYLIKMVI